MLQRWLSTEKEFLQYSNWVLPSIWALLCYSIFWLTLCYWTLRCYLLSWFSWLYQRYMILVGSWYLHYYILSWFSWLYQRDIGLSWVPGTCTAINCPGFPGSTNGTGLCWVPGTCTAIFCPGFPDYTEAVSAVSAVPSSPVTTVFVKEENFGLKIVISTVFLVNNTNSVVFFLLWKQPGFNFLFLLFFIKKEKL